MSKKKNYKGFVDAARAKGGVRYYALGSGVDLAQGAQQTPVAQPVQNTTQGGIFGALTPQNQYQAQLAPTTNLNYTPVVNTGFNTATGNIEAQQALEQQFLAQGMGQGPNPAQSALAQNTGANVANQAALMAGQRGAGANVGLMGRQIAQQGAATQQNAVGQAATLEAQQRLASQQAAAQQQANIGQQAQNLFGTGVSALGNQNLANISNYGQMQAANAQTAAANAKQTGQTGGGIIGGILGGIGSIFGLAEGGEVPPIPTPTPSPSPQEPNIDPDKAAKVQKSFQGSVGFAAGGPVSYAGKFLSGVLAANQQSTQDNSQDPLSSSIGTIASGLGSALGKATGLSSTFGSSAAPKTDAAAQGALAGTLAGMGAAKGGKVVHGETLAAKGKEVPGKAKVKGDNLKNDNVPAMLSPGEIVIPRSIAQHPDAPNKAAQFVQSIMAKKKHSKGK